MSNTRSAGPGTVRLNGPPSVRFVDLGDAGHYLFLKREAEVFREVRAFVAGLP
jgi:hypothetical protein